MLEEASNISVAAGTLLLAAATWWMAKTTRATVRESAHARLDALAPSITVLRLSVDDMPVQHGPSAAASLFELERGASWDMAKDGDVRIGVRAHGHVVNEGDTTARVELSAPSGAQIEFDNVQVRNAAGAMDVQSRPDGWLIGPKGNLSFDCVLWRSAKWWADQRRQNTDGPTPALGQIDITATSRTEAVVDSWRLSFGLLPFMRNPTTNGWLVVGASRFPDSTTAHAEIGPMTRAYS